MTTKKTIFGTPLEEIPTAVLREFWQSDYLSTDEYLEEKRRREREFISLSRDEVQALLMGSPKDDFCRAMIRLASWLEDRPVEWNELAILRRG